MKGRIELLQKRRGRQELVIIVGRGSHSEDGVSRLQPAIMSSLEESQGHTSECFPSDIYENEMLILGVL